MSWAAGREVYSGTAFTHQASTKKEPHILELALTTSLEATS
ncbi:hypothetical protein POX_b02007 [Penicillium oxalicum]|uniref:Uncharacterized protein n=1 Tax=Penicillium oxalicum (strain 114-2 / CGMCC 5302) TaxID=933388 RepID=S8AXD0_PENO1|nr:hypothetical protein POX_b02007 [Penicillium oxalicum]EPS31003.1 hypothetical protein PDE_05957 [Penicillium oxalicum 114-2]KAI2791978.1 hypothetical protein POX_b02007 [Penicillium oxalicum]